MITMTILEIKTSIMKGVEMATVLGAIRQAIQKSGQSRYAISKATGIDQGQLSKLMAGTCGLSIERLEQLARHLDLEIIVRPRQRRNRTRKGK